MCDLLRGITGPSCQSARMRLPWRLFGSGEARPPVAGSRFPSLPMRQYSRACFSSFRSRRATFPSRKRIRSRSSSSRRQHPYRRPRRLPGRQSRFRMRRLHQRNQAPSRRRRISRHRRRRRQLPCRPQCRHPRLQRPKRSKSPQPSPPPAAQTAEPLPDKTPLPPVVPSTPTQMSDQPPPPEPTTARPAEPEQPPLPAKPVTPEHPPPRPRPASRPTSAPAARSPAADASHGSRMAPASPAPTSRQGPPSVMVPPRPVAGMAADRPPVYPELARRRGEQGRVLLRVSVGADGTPLAVGIGQSSGHTSLDNAALLAVRQWRFMPAMRGGRPVSASAEVPIQFQLEN